MPAAPWHAARLQMDDTRATTTPNAQSLKEREGGDTTDMPSYPSGQGNTVHALFLWLGRGKYFWRCLWNDCHWSNVWWPKIAGGGGCAGVNRPVRQFLSFFYSQRNLFTRLQSNLQRMTVLCDVKRWKDSDNLISVPPDVLCNLSLLTLLFSDNKSNKLIS